MTRRTLALGIVLLAPSVVAAMIGIAVGYGPSGLMLFSAVRETQVGESIDLRAEAGIATHEIAGLRLATGTVLYYFPWPPVDPFVGLGGGIAMTAPPFTTGVLVEADAGLLIDRIETIGFAGRLRDLVRWSEDQTWPEPVFGASLQRRS